jgi:hypothetical protein
MRTLRCLLRGFAIVAPLHAASANDGQCFAPIDLTGDGIADLVRADPTANNGAAVCAVSDFNGDGLVDLVVGAPGQRRAYLMAG